jgi:hypothetical protein
VYPQQSGSVSSGTTGSVYSGISGSIYSGMSGSVWSGILNQGKKVLEQKLSVTGQIFINHLAKGLYLYRINNYGTIYKGKIIVD